MPDLRHSEDISTVTLGRLSKMMPITPSGTLLRSMRRPLGMILVSKVSPTGSGSEATVRTSSAIA
ncbi:hypothetical protein ES703_69010 [subsurface metagenome]